MATAGSKNWTEQVTNAVINGKHDAVLVQNLDDVLRWVLEKENPASRALDLHFKRAGLNSRISRQQTLNLVDRILFARTNEAWQKLGLMPTSNKKLVRERARRLTQVFHPDKGFGDQDWLNDRMEQIRGAQDMLLKGGSGGINSGPKVQQVNPGHRRPVNGRAASKAQKKADKAAARINAQVLKKRKSASRARTLRRIFGDSSTLKKRVVWTLTGGCIVYSTLMLVATISQ